MVKGCERGAREGGARLPASGASYQRIIKQLKELKNKLPKHNNYIFTISINQQHIIKSLNSQIHEYIRYFNKLLINLEIKIFYYIIEISKHGKIHCHGIFNRKELPTYKSINDRYPGVQIFINKFNTTFTEHRNPDTFECYRFNHIQPNDWHQYMSKEPHRLIFYKFGKNYSDYFNVGVSPSTPQGEGVKPPLCSASR